MNSKPRRIVFYQFEAVGFNNTWVHWNYIDELVRAGHDVLFINPRKDAAGSHSRSDYDTFITERVAEQHRRQRVDLFFSSVRQNEMSPGAIRFIKNLGIATVNATWDNILVPHRQKEIAREFDLCWVHEPEAVATLKSYGARVFHQPIAANPRLYRPIMTEEDIGISFCGQRRESRPHYIARILEGGLPIEIFGGGWSDRSNAVGPPAQRATISRRKVLRHVAGSVSHKHGRASLLAAFIRRVRSARIDDSTERLIRLHSHGSPPFEEMVSLFSRSKISLGINELGHTYLLRRPLYQVRLRDFEAPTSGACHIMYRIPLMQTAFEEGREMLFYASMPELIDKLRFYLKPEHDDLRLRIKANARQRSLGEHTWMHRFNRLFLDLGVDSRGTVGTRG